ncbi:PLP-dependent transferase [Lophiostoma macrostomum CBS 122681]|uniref:PLP-dependent transferase n=1 Tax=Lophiostoma macrostomum CBS 122681 TaxID=1314788 RepID=A0A6A6T9S9_9PLEO|nr:PLP-dependent transferase [Lophiostoma macrostomum CBS 122681]
MLQQRLADIKSKRETARPLPLGSAPFTSSSHFKIRQSGYTNKANRWDHRFSLESRNQHVSSLKSAARAIGPSDMISLGTARPSPQYFPWKSIVMHGQEYNDGTSNYPLIPPTSAVGCKGEEAYDLSVALNYGYAAGFPQVLRFVTEHVELIHSPQYEDWETCLTCGSTSAIDMAFRIFCDLGDWILVEAHTYPGAMSTAKSQRLHILGVDMDDDGLLPDDLDLKLRTWDESDGPKPGVVYMIPSGQNPTGVTQSTERRKAIYRMAEQHDLYIIEDDPYYYHQLQIATNTTQPPMDQYLIQLPVSYLSLDTSGRVLRLDSTSKILSPGLRCGWMTGCSQVVEKFLHATEVSTSAPSGASQLMMYKLLDESWGHEGFINWLMYLSIQYSHRRDTLIRACERYLPSDICQWGVPDIGMFVWMRLNVQNHPRFVENIDSERLEGIGLDLENRIYEQARQYGVLVSKGSWFAVDRVAPGVVHLRVTFVAAPEHLLEQAIERLGNAIRTEFTYVIESPACHPVSRQETAAPRDWPKTLPLSPGSCGSPTDSRFADCRHPDSVTTGSL